MLPAYGKWAAAKLRTIELELAARFGIEQYNLEPWQMIRYRRGDWFDYHLDCAVGWPSGRRVETATGVALIALGIVVASGPVTMPWLVQFPTN